MTEIETKIAQLEALLEDLGLETLVLKRVSSVAWATCGASTYVNSAATEGVATLVIKEGERHCFTTNIEAGRLANEEGLTAQGYEMHPYEWWGGNDGVAAMLTGGVGCDVPMEGAVDVSSAISRMRSILQPAEQDRLRALGRICGDAMQSAILRVKPGMTEYEIAAILGEEAQMRGAQPIVNLIATDDRIFAYRHPLPTYKRMEKYAMLVLCGRQHGLVASVTRLVHFGALAAELRDKANAVALIDATYLTQSRPGATLGEVFAAAQDVYAQTGFPDEWQLHHQGGPAGYEAREVIANPGMHYMVAAGQPYAWNPSITGCKSEDTALISEAGFEVVTTTPQLPTLSVEIGGVLVVRPDILVA
jgi:Xaa-Pro aminopeptidase